MNTSDIEKRVNMAIEHSRGVLTEHDIEHAILNLAAVLKDVAPDETHNDTVLVTLNTLAGFVLDTPVPNVAIATSTIVRTTLDVASSYGYKLNTRTKRWKLYHVKVNSILSNVYTKLCDIKQTSNLITPAVTSTPDDTPVSRSKPTTQEKHKRTSPAVTSTPDDTPVSRSKPTTQEKHKRTSPAVTSTPDDTPVSRSKPTIKRGTLDASLVPDKTSTSDSLLQSLQTVAHTTEKGSYAGSFFYVSNTGDDTHGCFYFNGKTSTIQLTDVDIQVTHVSNTLVTSSNNDYSLRLRCVNVDGVIMLFDITREQLEKNDLESKFIGYGSYPTNKNQQNQLRELIHKLARRSNVKKQRQADTLGWIVTDDGTRVFVLANGCESPDGFLTNDVAPIQAPPMSSSGNGYAGMIVSTQPDDIIMKKLLVELNPTIRDIVAGLLGNAAFIMLPLHNGMLRYVTEIVGPTRHGKSVLLNFILSLFGTGFNFRKGTYLNNEGGSGKGDSALGRGIQLSLVGYMLVSDFDNKIKPDDMRYETYYNLRNATNNMYADDGTSVVSSRTQKLKERPKHRGALVRTGETDYADYSQRKDMTSVEARVNTFIWSLNHKSNDDVSNFINQNRQELYIWGYWYRQWIMHHTNDELASIQSALDERAYQLVLQIVSKSQWDCDLHYEQCITMINGLLWFQQFVLEYVPQSFVAAWIDEAIPVLVTSRHNRCHHIHIEVKDVTAISIADEVINAIRVSLHQHTSYLKTNKNLLVTKQYLKEMDISLDLTKLGYAEYMNNGKLTYKTSGHIAGYIVDKGKYLAFDADMMMEIITTYSNKHNKKLGGRDVIMQALEQAGYIETSYEGDKKMYVKRVRIGGIRQRLVYMPFNVLFPVVDDTGDDANVDDVEIHTNTNISHISEHQHGVDNDMALAELLGTDIQPA